MRAVTGLLLSLKEGNSCSICFFSFGDIRYDPFLFFRSLILRDGQLSLEAVESDRQVRAEEALCLLLGVFSVVLRNDDFLFLRGCSGVTCLIINSIKYGILLSDVISLRNIIHPTLSPLMSKAFPSSLSLKHVLTLLLFFFSFMHFNLRLANQHLVDFEYNFSSSPILGFLFSVRLDSSVVRTTLLIQWEFKIWYRQPDYFLGVDRIMISD